MTQLVTLGFAAGQGAFRADMCGAAGALGGAQSSIVYGIRRARKTRNIQLRAILPRAIEPTRPRYRPNGDTISLP
jgi:hypothetical protein